jgi:hypothetical protein
MNISPKEFELLLCEFSKQDLPENFTVEHDIKDIGEESKNYRQIDTKIKGKLGIAEILICGEAKNWGKPVGSETIDALVGKYLSGEIRANKVIAFSNKGFTEPAFTRAKQLGIELLEPEILGQPIQEIPYVVAVGSIGQMLLRLTHFTQQQTFMALNQDEYTILKGDEKISLIQNVFRLVTEKLKEMESRDINIDLTKIKVRDANALYELKSKEFHKFNADFDIEVNINWDYHCLNLPSGILHHLNSGDIKFVHMEGDVHQSMNKILLSPNKKIYESKTDCLEEISKYKGYIFNMCLIDPDRNKTNPNEPKLTLI